MPRRDDLKTILIIGSGPIVIGQGCEFDYSGTQACKALREEGYRIVLVNSNPATIMTDPQMADRTYIEPITAEAVEKIIQAEKPDALLVTDDVLFAEAQIAILEMGIRVPDQLRIATHVNAGAEPKAPFPVTLLRVDAAWCAERLGEMLIQRMNGETVEPGLRAVTVEVVVAGDRLRVGRKEESIDAYGKREEGVPSSAASVVRKRQPV